MIARWIGALGLAAVATVAAGAGACGGPAKVGPAPVVIGAHAPAKADAATAAGERAADEAAPVDPRVTEAAEHYEAGRTANVDWRFPDAIAELEVALAGFDARLDAGDNRILNALRELTTAYRGDHRFADAEATARRWLAATRSAGDREGEATALNDLGLVLDDSGDSREASRAYLAGLAIDDELDHPADDAGRRARLHNLALSYSAQGDHQAAADLLEIVLVSDRALEPETASTANTIHNLANENAYLGNNDTAAELYREALVTLTLQLGADHPRVRLSMRGLASVQQDLGDYDESRRWYAQLAALAATGDPILYARALDDLAVVEVEAGEPASAIIHLDKAIQLLEVDAEANVVWLLAALECRMKARLDHGDSREAAADADNAIRMAARYHGADAPETATVIDELVAYYDGVKQHRKAKALRARARRLVKP